jgi:predicted nucleic acid-binding protein
VNFAPVYFDSSAIVKLIVAERESDALQASLAEWPDRVSAALAEVEVHRLLWRTRASSELLARARDVLDAFVLVRLDDAVLSRAATLKDRQLRALDAIHLATALSLGDDPEAFITYDARLARAAERERLPVRHPGAEKLD